MSGVRVLVGTRKGAFTLTSDGHRRDWEVVGPLFGGWEVFHVAGSPVDPDRLYASQSGGWFGQVVQRSDGGGRSWEPISNDLSYAGVPGTHQTYDGSSVPWEFTRVWHLTPSLTDTDTVFAGVEDAALFRSDDGGGSWHELAGLREHGTGSAWQPGAGGLCPHTIVLDPRGDDRITVAISAAGVFRTDDGGATWRPRNVGLRSGEIPDEDAEVGHCVHKLRRADHERLRALPPDGRLRVYRSRTGGGEWQALTRGLPQEHCYVDVLRDCLAVDRFDPCGLYLGTTGGQVYASADGGDSWDAIVRDLPPVLSVEVQTLP